MIDLSKNKTGLGPNSWGRVRIIFPYQILFYQAARYHDIAYERGGSSRDKEKADNMFLRLCLSVSKNNIQITFAYIYFIIVKVFGKKYFYFK